MSERTIDEDRVREEHLAEVHEVAHWAYLLGVVVGGSVLMLLLMAWLAG